jgi:hypothetical protein
MEGSMLAPKILPGILLVLPATMLLTTQSGFGGSKSGECKPSPGESAPAGLHWYYRIDRTNNRHCWFLHSNGMQVHTHEDGASPNPKPQHDSVTEQTNNVGEQSEGVRSQNGVVQAELQTPINPSDNNLVTIATGNVFQQVIGSNGSAAERQAIIIKNDNSNGDPCWVFFGSNKASKEKSVIVASGDSYVRYWPFVPSDAMQATCASSSDALNVEIK